MENLTKEQKERVEKFWDKERLNAILESNVPRHFIEHHLFATLDIVSDEEFLQKSIQLGIVNENVL
jgi:hypothetical protein